MLHHLDPVTDHGELARILRPGGRAAFSEPLGTNPIVSVRARPVPYPHKHEQGADIAGAAISTPWMAPFSKADLRGVQLFSMVERGLGFHTAATPARVRPLLLDRWPGLWPLCRYAVLTLTR